jgi:RNA polymerase sigma-70 factor, ECF subfamily
MTDNEIVRKIQKSDHSAIQWLYEKFYIALCVYANRFTKNKSSSEEIVQQTFFKLWEKREKLEIKESVSAYLYTSVRNNCLNYLKHEHIINRYSEAISQSLRDSEEFLAISQETGLSIFIAQELEQKINTAIGNLPEQCREIFKMSRFSGLKHTEIAKAKGITLNTVQKQISIALAKLKTELAEYLPVSIIILVYRLLSIK